MRINEYNNLSEFIEEYTGIRNPEDNKWFGLEFRFNNKYYRLDYSSPRIILFKMVFENYDSYPGASNYEEIGNFCNMEELLESRVIDGKTFKEVIMADETKLLGKD